jgi:hypothetical protein
LTNGRRLIVLSFFLISIFLCGYTESAWARFPTMLELKIWPNPAGVGDTVLIECGLYAKGASGTTQRARGGLLTITISSLSPRMQVNQFVDRPDGQYDVFEFPWNPTKVGRYKIEASYSGNNFLSAVRTSQTVTVSQTRPGTVTTRPRPTTTTAIKFTPSTTIPPPTTTTFFRPPPTTTTVWTPPPTTTTWRPPPSTTAWTPPPPSTTWAPAATTSTLPPPSGTGLEESTIGPEPGQPPAGPADTLPGTGGPPPGQDEGPLRAADNKIVTKVRVSVKPGPRPGQYLITVHAVTARGRALDDGDVLVTVNGGKLIPGAHGQALLSAAAGRQTLVWQKPKKQGTKKIRLEATYFGGSGPLGDYRMASASLSLPPGK